MPKKELSNSQTNLQPDKDISSSETNSRPELNLGEECQTNDVSNNTRLLNDLTLPIKKMSDMGQVLDKLDSNLERVMAQMESVKKTRDELFAQTRKLQQNLELYGGDPDLDSKKAERLESMSLEMKKREDVMRELEKREILVSHSMLAVMNSWVDELESNLKFYKRNLDELPDEVMEICNEKKSTNE